MSMPFWPLVLAALIGVPCVLFATGMGMIFAAAGLAGGPQAWRAKTIVHGWLAVAWLLVGVFGAFGVAPAWRAWHGGGENFGGGLQALVDWLVGAGAVGLLAAAVLRAMAAMRRKGARRCPLLVALRGLLLALGFVPWAAFAAWIAWPLVLWPVRGKFEWPDAATGWAHTGEVALILVAAMLVEDAVRRRRRR